VVSEGGSDGLLFLDRVESVKGDVFRRKRSA